jgi:hypothetical protein
VRAFLPALFSSLRERRAVVRFHPVDRPQAGIVEFEPVSPIPQPPEHPITVPLVEDHATARKALLALLALESDLRTFGQAVNGRQAVRRCLPSAAVIFKPLPF